MFYCLIYWLYAHNVQVYIWLCFVWKFSCITFHSLIHAYTYIKMMPVILYLLISRFGVCFCLQAVGCVLFFVIVAVFCLLLFSGGFFFFFWGGGQYWGRGRGNFHSNMVLANHKQTHILFSPGYSTNKQTKASAVCQFQPQHNTQYHNCSKLVGRTQTCVPAQQSHHLTATCNDGSSVCMLGEQSMTTKGEEPR